MANQPNFPKADVKSGNESNAYASKVLGGTPPKKSVEQIAEVNTPGDSSKSVSK